MGQYVVFFLVINMDIKQCTQKLNKCKIIKKKELSNWYVQEYKIGVCTEQPIGAIFFEDYKVAGVIK